MSHRKKHDRVSTTRHGEQEAGSPEHSQHGEQHEGHEENSGGPQQIAKIAQKARFLGTAAWQTVAGAKKADKLVRNKPYQSIAVAFGLGLLLGCMIKRGPCSES